MTASPRIVAAILLVDKSQGVNFPCIKIGRAFIFNDKNLVCLRIAWFVVIPHTDGVGLRTLRTVL